MPSLIGRSIRASQLLGVLAFAMLAGCAASSKYMKPTTRRPLARPPADRAVVVFMRPSEFGSAVPFQLFDGRKRFIGDALPATYWEVVVEPGEHWFYAMAENAGVLHARLAAGRRYYVVVRPYMGLWSARVELTALAPRSVDWPKRDEWLQSANPQMVDQRGGQAELDANAPDVNEAIADAGEIWRSTDEEWHEAHRLRPEDGEGTPIQPASPQPMENVAAPQPVLPAAAAPDPTQGAAPAEATAPAPEEAAAPAPAVPPAPLP